MTITEKAETLAQLFLNLHDNPLSDLNDAAAGERDFAHLLSQPVAQHQQFYDELTIALMWAMKQSDWYKKVLHTPEDVERNLVRLLDDYRAALLARGDWKFDFEIEVEVHATCGVCGSVQIHHLEGVEQTAWTWLYKREMEASDPYICIPCQRKTGLRGLGCICCIAEVPIDREDVMCEACRALPDYLRPDESRLDDVDKVA